MPEPTVDEVTGRSPSTAPEPPARRTIADAVADFVQMFVDYVRQETGDLVKDKLVVPVQKAGQVVAFALAAAMVLALGIGYISVGLMMLIATWIGWPATLLAIGGVLVLGAGLFTYLKMRSIQR